MHEYPSYTLFGKRLPTGHVGLLGLVGVYAVVKSLIWVTSSGSSSKKSHAAIAGAHGQSGEVEFPLPKRDWEAEKREFVQSYVEKHAH